MNDPLRSVHLLAGALALVLGSAAVVGAAQETARPTPRSCFGATAAPQGGVLVWGGAKFCGVDVVADGSLWLWDGRAWEERAGPPIEPRDDALLVNGPGEGVLTLLGGRRRGVAFDDVWVREDDVWRSPDTQGGPGPIQHGAAALDPVRKRIVVFGGAGGSAQSGITHEWDGARWHAFDVPGPAPRIGHGLAWSERDGGVLLYGGFSDEKSFRDLWRWDGASWKLVSEDGPTFTEGAVVAEAERGIHVVGAGLDPAGTTVRAWRWDGAAFVALGDARPPLRIGAGVVYDRARRVLVLLGGSDASGRPDASIWELDGLEWKDRSARSETQGQER